MISGRVVTYMMCQERVPRVPLVMQQFVELMKWSCNLPYQNGGKTSHKEKVFVLHGIDQEKKVDIRGVEKSFV
jgi:hypothetical protein